MFGLIELLFLPLVLFAIPLGLLALGFWIWMLVHAAQNKGLSDGERIAWILIIVFVHFIGALIYFCVGRPKGNQAIPVPGAR